MLVRRLMAYILVLLLTPLAGGCAPGVRASDATILRAMQNGDFGVARSIAMRERAAGGQSKRELLDRELVLWTALAEGDMPVATREADEVYDWLRLQGINKNTEVGRFFTGDQAARFWKGEPFEQAAALAAIAVVDGVNGDWGNMRASALSSTFQLRELAEVEGEDAEGFRFVASDFAPGYALAALSERRLGLRAEMEESLRAMTAINAELGPLASRIRSGSDNAAFIIDFGHAPERVAAGEDGSIAAYRERTPGGSGAARVAVAGRGAEAFPALADYNRLANDLKWSALEEQRRAKSAIGTGLIYGGIGVASLSDDEGAQLAGLGAALAGLALKATSGADTRQCVAVPQRTYLALTTLPPGRSDVTIEIEGAPNAIVDVPVESDGTFQLFYVRVASDPRQANWGGAIRYANDTSGAIERPTLPWVLGGRCVRAPSRALMREYRQAGLPEWVTVDDLRSMYEEEGFAISGFGPGAPNGVHVLEGGNAMYAPEIGSAGFARLFCREHPTYVPRGELAIRILEDIR
ncbi:MAG: hypothetical protein RIB32_01015 [Phycisphaerales bacterium]